MSIRDSSKCTRSNEINGSLGQIAKEKNMCGSYSLIQHVGKRGLN